MKNVALGSLVFGSLVSLLGAGCVVETLEDGVIHANVTLSSAGGGAVGACQGGDALRLNYQDELTGDGTSELFNCTDTDLHSSGILPGGTYTVWVDYVNDAGTPADVTDDDVVGTTSALTIDVDGDIELDINLELDHGFIAASWDLENGDGNPVACSDVVGENGISILGTLVGTAEGFDTLYNCEDTAGFSQPVPLGDYVVLVDILDADDLSLGTSGEIPASVPDGNDYDDLGQVTIVLD